MVNPNADDTQFFKQGLSKLRRNLEYESSSPEQWLDDARALLRDHPDREEALQPLLREFQDRYPGYEEAVSEILGGRMPRTDEERNMQESLSDAYHEEDWQQVIDAYEWLKNRDVRVGLQYQRYYEEAQQRITQPDRPDSPDSATDTQAASSEATSTQERARATRITPEDERTRKRISGLLSKSESAMRRDLLDEALKLVEDARGLWDTMEYPDKRLDDEIANYSDRVMRQRDEQNRIREAQDALADGNWQRAYEIYDTAYHTFGEDPRFGKLADQMSKALQDQADLISQVKEIDPMTEDVDRVIGLQQDLRRLPNRLSQPPLSFQPAPTEQQTTSLDEVNKALRKIAKHWLNEGETALQEAYQSANLQLAEERLNDADRVLRRAQTAARDDSNLSAQVTASIRGVSERRSELQTTRIRRRVLSLVLLLLIAGGVAVGTFLYFDNEQQQAVLSTERARQTAAILDADATQTQTSLDARNQQGTRDANATETERELRLDQATQTSSAIEQATANAQATERYIRENPPTATPVFLCRGASTVRLAVRSGPSPNFNAITELQPGDEVEVYAIESGWYEIEHRSGSGRTVQGWVSASFIDIFDSCND